MKVEPSGRYSSCLGEGVIMKLPKREPTGREKDEAALDLLEKLRYKLHFGNAGGIRRSAAFHLSWMQEDGLEILQEAIFGKFPKTSKTAAAYGLRNMHGRMKKKARDTLEDGLKHPDKSTREVCKHALDILKKGKRKKGKHPIREYKRKKTEPSNRRSRISRR